MQAGTVQGNKCAERASNLDIHVGIADFKIIHQPYRLITVGLGSCVGLSFYDPVLKLGGLLHIMLPDSKRFSNIKKPAKFADTGIYLLLQEMKRYPVRINRLQVKIAGGAQMFKGSNENFQMNIGEQNIEAAKSVLRQLGLKLMAEDVGGSKGRTMCLDTCTGQVIIRKIDSPLRSM
jgi:chemotaxis protein CheD